MLQHKSRDSIDFSFYVQRHTLGFTGREWVFEAIEDWLAKSDRSRFFVLTGDPGSGKTGIASRLLQFARKEVSSPDGLTYLLPGFLHAAYFCSARDSRWISPHTFTESLAFQLAQRLPRYAKDLAEKSGDRQIVIEAKQRVRNAKKSQIVGVLIKKLDVSAVSPETAFNRVVREPLEELFRDGFDQQVIILVDALDEALLSGEKQNIATLLTLTENLPAGVRFIVTTRPETEVLRPLRQFSVEEHSLTTGEELLESEGDVQQYVVEVMNSTYPTLEPKLASGLSSAGFTHIIRAKSKGNFLYVQYLLKKLEDYQGTITKEVLDSLPEGLEGIYLEFLRRLIGNDQKMWEERYLPIAGTLAIAQEPLSEKQLADVVNAPETRVRSSLKALRQLLEVNDSLPASKRTFTVYHRSFADFLLDSDRAENYWCQAEEQHRRIANHYRGKAVSWREVGWERVDDYGLRHLTLHVVKGYEDGLNQISEMIQVPFIRTKNARFNTERSILDDLRLAVVVARETANLLLLLRWTWVYASWRDRIAQAMIPELLHLYVRIGQADRALDMIKVFDSTRLTSLGEERKAHEYLAYALTEQGLVEQALALSQTISDAANRGIMLSGVAQRVARQDRARAIQIIREGHISSVSPELCRLLAEDEAFLKDALEIAQNSGPALEAIALQVADRDIDRALTIVDSIEPYDEVSGGDIWMRTSDVARVNLAIRIVGTNPDQALVLLRRIKSTQEIHRALIGIASMLAKVDARQALALVDSFGEIPDLVKSLALAHIAMKSNDPDIQKDVRQRWDTYHTKQTSSATHRNSIDLIARLDLTQLQSHPLAFDIAFHAITELEDSVKKGEWWSSDLIPVKYVYQAVGVLGAAHAVFDLDCALNFLEWAFKHESLRTSEKQDALLMVVDMVARFDPKGAQRVIDRIEGAQLHQAYVAAIKHVSKYNYEQALEIIDRVDSVYSSTKAILLGVLGNQLGLDQKEKARELFSHVPHYIHSNNFRFPLCKAITALAGEIARSNIDRGIALVEQYRSLWSEEDALKGIHLVDVAQCAAEHDLERAMKLASQITDGFGLAQVMLAIARHSSLPEEALVALQKASTVLVEAGMYFVSVPHIHLLTDIAVEMAPLTPWSALDLVKRMKGGAEQERALEVTLQAILSEEAPLLESTSHLQLWALQHLVERLYHRASDKGTRIVIFRALLNLLDPTLSTPVLDWLETRDVDLSTQLCGWYLAESAPDAALSLFAAAGLANIAQRVVIVRSAARFPDRALELYHRGSKDPEVLVKAIGAIAKRDSTRALAITAAEPWKYQLNRWQALDAVASAVAESDWQQALDIIQPISDDSLRGMALRHIVAALPEDLTPDDTDLAITRLTREAKALPYPGNRLDVYESLIGFLQARPFPLPAVTANLVEVIGMGDSGVFLQLLPDLMRLICKGDLKMPLRLEAELEYIEALLDA